MECDTWGVSHGENGCSETHAGEPWYELEETRPLCKAESVERSQLRDWHLEMRDWYLERRGVRRQSVCERLSLIHI